RCPGSNNGTEPEDSGRRCQRPWSQCSRLQRRRSERNYVEGPGYQGRDRRSSGGAAVGDGITAGVFSMFDSLPVTASSRLTARDYKTLWLATLGGILEFYDFIIFVFFAN